MAPPCNPPSLQGPVLFLGCKKVPKVFRVMQTTRQPTSQKSMQKNRLPPKSSSWTGHVGSDKNLVISFSDDDSGSDVENKGNASRLNSNLKRPSTSLEKSNQLKLQQNAKNLHKEMPKRPSANRTFVSSATKIPSSNYKVAGSLSLGQGSRARNFNPMSKTFASRERGCDQGAVSNDNKLQDLRHQIALRESELKLKAAQQNQESASALGRDQNAMNLKNDTARKNSLVSSGAAQLEPKEPDRKRMKFGTSHDTPQAVGGQQEVPAVKSILPSKDFIWGNLPQEKNKVDHNQNEIPSCRGESTLIISQRKPDNLLDNSLQNMPSRLREGDVNYGCNQTEKSSRLVNSCIAFNQSAMPANMSSNSVPKNLEALSNGVLMNRNANVSEHSGTDLQLFFGVEELIDKELEEAQEHKHKCEIEERNALRAYLKAQRSLLEANAQCNNLYRQRELYSAKLRSLILNNSSFSWSLGLRQQLDIGLDYLPKHGYEMPTSSCQRQAEYNNNHSFDSNNRGIDNRRSDTSYHQTTGANLRSEPCIEPDASTSEPLPQRGKNAADGVYSPLDELDASGNENEEISPAGHASNHIDAENHRKQDSRSKQMDIDTASNANFSTDCPQDSLLLEATLRSEFLARLGIKAMKSNGPCSNIETAAERGAENEVGSEKRQVHHGAVPLSNAEDNDLRGIQRQERNIYLDSTAIQSQQNIGGSSLHANCSAGSGDQGDMSFQGLHSTNPVNIPPLIFMSAFGELREVSPFTSNQLPNNNKFTRDNDDQSENATCLSSDETKRNNLLAISMPVTIGSLLSEESSYGCSPAVDPFWPLCMYELRGKCNNDECPWQHAKNYGDGNIYQNQHTDSNNADSEDRPPLHHQNCNGVAKVTKYHTDKKVVDPVGKDHTDKKVADPVAEYHKDIKVADPVGEDHKAKEVVDPVSDTKNNAMLSTFQQSLMLRQEPTPEATKSPNGSQQPGNTHPTEDGSSSKRRRRNKYKANKKARREDHKDNKIVDPVGNDRTDKKVADPVAEDHNDIKVADPVVEDHKAKEVVDPVSDTNNAMLSTFQQSLMPRQELTPEATESPNGSQQPGNTLPTEDGSSSKRRRRNKKYKANKKARRESELQAAGILVNRQAPPCSVAQ